MKHLKQPALLTIGAGARPLRSNTLPAEPGRLISRPCPLATGLC